MQLSNFGCSKVVVPVLVIIAVLGSSLSAHAQKGPPKEILSWRHEFLPREEYERLAKEWEIYSKKNPSDPRALIEWGDALRYSGEHEEAKKKYAEAYRVDPSDAAAIAKHTSNILIYDVDGADWDLVHNRLLQASRIEPDYAETYYTLWMTALQAGDRDLAAHCLKRVVELGDMSRPLLDYGYNMIVGAPRDAIILTNGDNDTYPPLACQAVMDLRPDVTIVNLSLLNTQWYIKHLRSNGIPIGLNDTAIGKLEYEKDNPISNLMQRHIYDRLVDGGWDRPLCYAVTVPDYNRVLPGTVSLEGLLCRIIPEGAREEAEELNIAKTTELFETVYRMDSITDPLFDWERENALGRLGTNYAALLAKVGTELMAASKPDESEPYLYLAVDIATFHDQMREYVDTLLDDWEKKRPKSEFLDRAKGLVKSRR